MPDAPDLGCGSGGWTEEHRVARANRINGLRAALKHCDAAKRTESQLDVSVMGAVDHSDVVAARICYANLVRDRPVVALGPDEGISDTARSFGF